MTSFSSLVASGDCIGFSKSLEYWQRAQMLRPLQIETGATVATGFRRLFLCSSPFLGKRLRRPVAFVAGLGGLSFFRVLAASMAALAGRSGDRNGYLSGPQAEGAGKPSGAAPRPGNEVFALLGRTGTRQCLVAVTGTPL